jgi:hypothetical protein
VNATMFSRLIEASSIEITVNSNRHHARVKCDHN